MDKDIGSEPISSEVEGTPDSHTPKRRRYLFGRPVYSPEEMAGMPCPFPREQDWIDEVAEIRKQEREGAIE